MWTLESPVVSCGYCSLQPPVWGQCGVTGGRMQGGSQPAGGVSLGLGSSLSLAGWSRSQGGPDPPQDPPHSATSARSSAACVVGPEEVRRSTKTWDWAVVKSRWSSNNFTSKIKQRFKNYRYTDKNPNSINYLINRYKYSAESQLNNYNQNDLYDKRNKTPGPPGQQIQTVKGQRWNKKRSKCLQASLNLID